uniref:Uncharacterized protein n=1 Tax=Oryza glumipatula TaxID=40148 RepID=A0A0E0ARM5_9ORYZ
MGRDADLHHYSARELTRISRRTQQKLMQSRLESTPMPTPTAALVFLRLQCATEAEIRSSGVPRCACQPRLPEPSTSSAWSAAADLEPPPRPPVAGVLGGERII